MFNYYSNSGPSKAILLPRIMEQWDRLCTQVHKPPPWLLLTFNAISPPSHVLSTSLSYFDALLKLEHFCLLCVHGYVYVLGSREPRCRGPGTTFRRQLCTLTVWVLRIELRRACWAESILKRISQAQIISEFNLVFCLPVELATNQIPLVFLLVGPVFPSPTSLSCSLPSFQTH